MKGHFAGGVEGGTSQVTCSLKDNNKIIML